MPNEGCTLFQPSPMCKKKGVRAYKCFICQLVFKKVWLPQQLPQSCDLQHDTSCMLHSTVSVPLAGVSGVICACAQCYLHCSSYLSPEGNSLSQLMEAGGQNNVCFHILTAFWLGWSVGGLEFHDPMVIPAMNVAWSSSHGRFEFQSSKKGQQVQKSNKSLI